MPRAGSFGVQFGLTPAGQLHEDPPSAPPTPHPLSTPPLLSPSARRAALHALISTAARSCPGHQLTVDEVLEDLQLARWQQAQDHPGTAT